MTFDTIRTDFRKIMLVLANIKIKFDSINAKIKKLKDVYDDLTTTNHDPIYIVGLDFLNFQYKVFHTQYKSLVDMIKLINNRIYGDYYKLYDLITCYVREKIDDKVFLANIGGDDGDMPVYKDLDEYYDYSSEVLLGVNAKVIGILKKMNTCCTNKDKVNEKYLKLTQSGFFLDNFLHSFETNNSIVRNQFDLYMKNIDFFNKNHAIILETMYSKICDLYNEITGDIEFDEDGSGSGSGSDDGNIRIDRIGKKGVGMNIGEASEASEASEAGDDDIIIGTDGPGESNKLVFFA